MKTAWISLAAVCALVIGLYAYVAQSGVLELQSSNAADSYYNLLVQGFRAGQLSVKAEVPPGLAELADPNAPSPFGRSSPGLNLSYYKGRLYLYFGVTPALILFWPFAALTGHYLFHRQAVVIFCAIGFLASVSLLRALWRRHFAEVGLGVVVACVLALGLATSVPVLLSQSDVWEVPISCGYMLTMLALGAIWCALHEPERRGWWLAAASLAYGLAVGARPNLLFGAVILLVPVVQSWREHRKILTSLMAATGPIMLIGLGLMLYNARRFGNPFEFGWHYQLAEARQDTGQHFSLRYLWFNFRAYFLEPVHWTTHSPFVQVLGLPSLPAGYYGAADTFGILTNIPLVWLALAVPLAWRARSEQAGRVLRSFVTAVALLFGICASTVGLFYGAAARYEVDFLPALMLLAVVGILGLERALTGRPVWRCALRCGWSLLLGFSVAFNLLACIEHHAEAQNNLGRILLSQGKVTKAIAHFERALGLNPDLATAHSDLGGALYHVGKRKEAIEQYEQALRINPDYAEARNNLANALARAGRLSEAIGQYEKALRINPDLAAAHFNLGIALSQVGRSQDSLEQFLEALRLSPDSPEVHYYLGNALAEVGRVPEAVEHFQQALRIKPDYAEAHYNLGIALAQTGKTTEAIAQFEEALRLRPDLIQAQDALARLQARR